MIDLTGKTISKVEFVRYADNESYPDYCDKMLIKFSDGYTLQLSGESSQDMGYIEITLSE